MLTAKDHAHTLPKTTKGTQPGALSFFLNLMCPDQFGIKSGTIVTITGNIHNSPKAPTWINTNGMIPR